MLISLKCWLWWNVECVEMLTALNLICKMGNVLKCRLSWNIDFVEMLRVSVGQVPIHTAGSGWSQPIFPVCCGGAPGLCPAQQAELLRQLHDGGHRRRYVMGYDGGHRRMLGRRTLTEVKVKSSMARSLLEENLLPLISRWKYYHWTTCSNATEVAQMGNFKLQSTRTSYGQWWQRR